MRMIEMNRLSWIDAAKGISIILVVLLHIIDELIPRKDITHTIEFLYQMERSIGRVAVPVFIMISGFLI
ncbi:acyltransferase family protein, partial [Serratia ureilytica]